MAASIREQIIAAAVAVIDAATSTPVYRTRTAALAADQLPAIVVSPLRDIPNDRDDTNCWTAWELMLAVDVVVAGDPPDQAAGELVGVCHAALMAAARDLGVDGVTDVVPSSTELLSDSSGAVTGVTRMTVAVRYRTQQADLAAVP